MLQFQEISGEFRAAEERDIDQLVHNMRECDREEMTAASGPNVENTLHLAFDISEDLATFQNRKGVVCMFGCRPYDLMDTTGVPWLIGTDMMRYHKRTALTFGRTYVEALLTKYARLVNFVDERNKWSKVYLRRIGFTLDEPKPYGIAGLPFHRFYREAARV